MEHTLEMSDEPEESILRKGICCPPHDPVSIARLLRRMYFWITAVELISNPRTSIDVTRVSAARSRPCICRVSVALSEPNFERHGWFGKNT
jgi:hypothetical protein